MKWTLLIGTMLILSIPLCGCVGTPCGPCGPYGSYGSGMYGGCSTGMCVDECGSCDPCGSPSGMNYAYGGSCATPYCGLPGAPLRTVGCGAAQVASRPVSWLAQILRGSNYPCNGCGDEVYWGDYGYVSGDFCSPCTYDGQWAGNDHTPSRYGNCGGCGECTVCQQGISYRYPAVGSYMNQMYAPVFQDKISSTHAKTPLDYGLRSPYAMSCDPCGYDPCCDDGCYTADSCSTGMCDTGCDTGCSTGGYGSRISPGYAPTRQRACNSCGTGSTHTYIEEDNTQPVSPVTTSAYRSAKPSSSRVAGKVYPPVNSQTYRR